VKPPEIGYKKSKRGGRDIEMMVVKEKEVVVCEESSSIVD
jgi:hypothetical protein